jgi:hypothetical protein
MSGGRPLVSMRQALEDPDLLGGALPGLTWRAWRILLIASRGEGLDIYEREIFSRLTGREREPLEAVEELVCLVGRRGGKSRAAAALAVYLACFVDYSSVLAAGERGVILCLAQNQVQARVVLSYAAGIIHSVPLLNDLVASETADSITLKSGVVIEVRAANFRGLRGTTILACIADETCFWFNEDDNSRNADSEILDAVRPGLATTGGPLIVISSPYARRGEVYETWKAHFGAQGDPRILVAHGASRDLNPSLPQSVVDRAMERDPASASAEFLAIFRSDIASYISREAVEACVDDGCFERLPASGVVYIAFTDPSGGSADGFTLAIAHREANGRVVLDLVREHAPPFSPANVVTDFAAVLKAYHCARVVGDRYAGEFPRELFRNCGVTYEPSERSKSEIYVELLPLINSRRVDLLDDKKSIGQLVALERRTSRSGKDSIDHPPAGKDDRINAIGGALVLASADQGVNVSPEFLAASRAGFAARRFRQAYDRHWHGF